MPAKVLTRTALVILASACTVLWGCSAVSGLPPVISYMLPAEDSGNVPYASTITAVFSRPMNPATVTTSSFTVSIGGVPVAGTVSCSGDTATFTPASLLPGNCLVTATVTTGAKDVNGTALAADRTWTFMTVPVFTPGNIILYYAYTFDVNPWTRSLAPVTQTQGGNVVSQSYNPADGSVTLTITNAAAYEDNGFYFYVGELRYLNTIKVVASPGSGTYGANIYLDTDSDGQFFFWTGLNQISGLGGDYYGSSATGPVGGVLTIDSSTSFGMTSSGGGLGNFTLAQLKLGALAGVANATRAAIYIGSSISAGSWTATIQTITVN